MERVCFKVAPEGLSHGRDSRGKCPSGGGVFILVRSRNRGITVVEHNVGAARQAGDEAERRKDGLLC